MHSFKQMKLSKSRTQKQYSMIKEQEEPPQTNVNFKIEIIAEEPRSEEN